MTSIFLALYATLCFNVFHVIVSIGDVSIDRDWPNGLVLGQPSGISVDIFNNVYVFHRGERIWSLSTFLFNNSISDPEIGPIKEKTIVVLNENGTTKLVTGSNSFFMPHGLTVDHENFVWITDVAMHQVFKYPPLIQLDGVVKDLQLPLLTIGERLVPGSGRNHFCKPTSVAVDSKTEEFFVADGYCNSRIIKYDPQGNFLMSWGKQTIIGFPPRRRPLTDYELFIPHSLALDEPRNLILVADRENSRTMFYNSTSGNFVFQMKHEYPVYGIAYSKAKEYVVSVTSQPQYKKGESTIYSLKQNKALTKFVPPNGPTKAHDVAINSDGSHIYVVELDPHIIWRFTIDKSNNDRIGPSDQHDSAHGDYSADSAVSDSAFKEERIGLEQSAASPSVSVVADPKRPDATLESLAGSHIAISVVTILVLLTIVGFGFHIHHKRGLTQNYELHSLIADDDE